jgi:hypothetical protein
VTKAEQKREFHPIHTLEYKFMFNPEHRTPHDCDVISAVTECMVAPVRRAPYPTRLSVLWVGYYKVRVHNCGWWGQQLCCEDWPSVLTHDYSGNGKRKAHPRGIPLVTRMQELQTSTRGIQSRPEYKIPLKRAHRTAQPQASPWTVVSRPTLLLCSGNW